MNFRFATSALSVALLAQLCACTITTSDTGTGGSTSTSSGSTATTGAGGGTDLGDCVPYAPATIADKKSGAFASGDDYVKFELPKTDLGGGLLKVTYVQAGPVTAAIFLAEGAEPNVPRDETTAFGPGVTDDAPAVVYYRLAGNKSYQLGIKSFVYNADKPSYSVEYSYEPLVDCYEANDTSAAARRVPVNTTITAYHHTGIGKDDTGLVNDTGDDWYYFELDASKTVKLQGVLPGKDGPDGGNSAQFTVYTADGTTTPACSGSETFETDPVAPKPSVETCSGELAAGKYLVRLKHFASQFSATSVNGTFNASWNTPYTFQIDAK